MPVWLLGETGGSGMVKREWYRDRYNSKKTWEVVKMVGGYYLRQYVDGQQVKILDSGQQRLLLQVLAYLNLKESHRRAKI